MKVNEAVLNSSLFTATCHNLATVYTLNLMLEQLVQHSLSLGIQLHSYWADVGGAQGEAASQHHARR
jgi:hypothetical protein